MEFKRKRYHAHLDIAPLVDVVLNLLLFFMLTSHFIQEPAFKIRLPPSSTAEARQEGIKTILITKEYEIYLMAKKVDLGSLRQEIQSWTTAIEKDVWRIKADREVSVGFLVSVIDEVRLAGVKDFSIVTERR